MLTLTSKQCRESFRILGRLVRLRVYNCLRMHLAEKDGYQISAASCTDLCNCDYEEDEVYCEDKVVSAGRKVAGGPAKLPQ